MAGGGIGLVAAFKIGLEILFGETVVVSAGEDVGRLELVWELVSGIG
jgi:hypothetical protein